MAGKLVKRKPWRWWAGALVAPAACAAAVTAAVAVAQSLSVEGGLAALERNALGWMLIHRPSRSADPRIVLVAADTSLYERREAPVMAPEPPEPPAPEHALESYRRAPDCGCPIPRRCYAEAVRRLHRWGARAVVIDVMFRQPGVSVTDRQEDAELEKALLSANNVIVAAPMQALALDRSRDPAHTADVVLDPPAERVAASAWSVGSPRIDPRDEEYAFELWQTAHTSTGELADYFSMPYLAYCRVTGHPPEDLSPWRRQWVEGTEPRLLGSLFSRQSPAAEQGSSAATPGADRTVSVTTTGNATVDEAFYQKRLLINYSVGADPEVGRFRPVRLSWLLSCSEAAGKARFGGKVVLVGNPAVDLHRTLVGAMPGTEVMANALQTLLQGRPLVPVPAGPVLGLMLVASLLAGIAVRQFPALPAAGFLMAELLGLILLSLLCLQRDTWLLSVCPIWAVVGTAGLAWFLSSKSGQETVARLVPDRLSRALERAGGLAVEDGSVLFSDIRGYSSFSEYMDPAEMMTRLNAYFGTVDDILVKYNGHFMKSPGDCVVAWFSEEAHGAHHTERAIRAGIELLMNAERFRARWPDGQGRPFEIGVGINTGRIALGLLDAHRHIEPTLIGDTVNLASRLESLTKQYGAALIVSEETLDPARSAFLWEPLGEVTVKGRSQGTRIYRILGMAPDAAMPKRSKSWLRKNPAADPELLRFRMDGGRPELSVPPAPEPAGTPAEEVAP